MKFTSLLENKNPGWKPGEPYWELDINNKVYSVHTEDGIEVERYPFQHVWDSSPAKRRAQEKFKEVYGVYYEKKKATDYATAQAKPLSQVEERYYKLSQAVKNYARYIWPKVPEDNILDKETRDLYLVTSTKWLEEMNRLSGHGIIRKSLIDGTYKPAE